MQWLRSRGDRELRFGLYGAAVLVVVLIAVGVLYALPIGKATYTAELTEGRSVQVGDEVRIAGVHVGNVKSLTLLPDRVRMTFTVSDNVTLGDQTSLEVRMLTVVGGHYVAAFPAGDQPLRKSVIPADRVRLPYSLIRTLQDAATPIAQVDGDTLRKNLAALQDSLNGSPDALRRIGNATQTFIGILDRQNAEVSRALTVTDEFLTAVDQNKSLLGVFVRKVGLLETEGLDQAAAIKEALRVAGELLARIAGLEPTWRTQLEPLVDKLLEALPQLKDLGARLDTLVLALTGLQLRLKQDVTPESGIVVDQSAVTICVPVPGRGC
ncbi:MCE family protein [Nocardia yunnanensis]|uniref:MCE family protein n=1 Tax=Nocardia yunnanensis TaxID=2382165 RepID=A0A386ZB27_9NOCA|nr:MlaD family protein [Nocardia yunnanensis]AYF74830.1 MCE family protein [Nocardia yunnanensis]